MKKSICFRNKICKSLFISKGEDKSKDRYGCAWGQMRKTANTIRKLPIECKAKYFKYEKPKPDRINKKTPLCLKPLRRKRFKIE